MLVHIHDQVGGGGSEYDDSNSFDDSNSNGSKN